MVILKDLHMQMLDMNYKVSTYLLYRYKKFFKKIT